MSRSFLPSFHLPPPRLRLPPGTDCVNGEALLALRGAFRENGLYNLFRPPLMHVAPALVMTPAELEDGFEKVDRSFATFQAILDANNNKA